MGSATERSRMPAVLHTSPRSGSSTHRLTTSHWTPHAPQSLSVSSAVSHPSAESALQSPRAPACGVEAGSRQTQLPARQSPSPAFGTSPHPVGASSTSPSPSSSAELHSSTSHASARTSSTSSAAAVASCSSGAGASRIPPSIRGEPRDASSDTPVVTSGRPQPTNPTAAITNADFLRCRDRGEGPLLATLTVLRVEVNSDTSARLPGLPTLRKSPPHGKGNTQTDAAAQGTCDHPHAVTFRRQSFSEKKNRRPKHRDREKPSLTGSDTSEEGSHRAQKNELRQDCQGHGSPLQPETAVLITLDRV